MIGWWKRDRFFIERGQVGVEQPGDLLLRGVHMTADGHNHE
jgi:hypothetical protein